MKSNLFLGLLSSLMAFPAFGLLIENNESDFLNSASIEQTLSFEEEVVNTGFIDKNIALGGVMFSTEDCTNRCWSFYDTSTSTAYAGLGTGIGSNDIANNVLGFGTGRFVYDFGLRFLSGSSLQTWEGTVFEIDGTQTDFSIANNNSYFGFKSEVGIGGVAFRDDPSDSSAGNWIYSDISRGKVLGGEDLDDCEPVLPPGLGGPSGQTIGTSCIEGETEFPYTASVPEPSSLALIVLGLFGLATRYAKAQS